MLTIFIALIIIIQETSPAPLSIPLDQLQLRSATDQVNELFYGGKTLTNMNLLMIINAIAEKMDKTPPFKGTNASEEFKNKALALAQVPMALGGDVIEGITSIGETLDKLQQEQGEATLNNADTTADENGVIPQVPTELEKNVIETIASVLSTMNEFGEGLSDDAGAANDGEFPE